MLLVQTDGQRAPRHEFQLEMIVQAKQKGLSVGKVGITFVDRVYREPKLGATRFLPSSRACYSLFITT